MEIAIPSAHRANHLAKSLRQLDESLGYDVTFYVPADQQAEYRAFLPGWIDVAPVRDCTTVSDARNAIAQAHAGSRVVIMEDDIPFFVGSRHVFPPTNHGAPPSTPRLHVHEVAALGFQEIDFQEAGIWGIYPVAYSGTQLRPRIAFGALFLVGHLIGWDVPHQPPTLRLPVKEDYELSAWAIEYYGRVVRLDCIAPYSTSGKGAGGTNTYRTPELERECAQRLIDSNPRMFTRRAQQKGRQGMAQVSIKGDVTYVEMDEQEGWYPYVPR